MVKSIWVVKGLGSDNAEAYNLSDTETVADFKCKYAKEFGVNASEIEVTTKTKKLTNESKPLSSLVKDKDTVHVIPRAKAGDE